MESVLHQDDIVIVCTWLYLFMHPRINDIVAVRDPRDGKILIKRIKRIQNGKYFVLGDNKTQSTDSRKFGMLKKNDIVGKVIYKISNSH
jgi:nickel-type superoxide dismutase maturation protease